MELLHVADGDVNNRIPVALLLWKTIWQLLIMLSCNLKVLLLDIYSGEMEMQFTERKKPLFQMFVADKKICAMSAPWTLFINKKEQITDIFNNMDEC